MNRVLFGNRIFADIIKMTGVLLQRGEETRDKTHPQGRISCEETDTYGGDSHKRDRGWNDTSISQTVNKHCWQKPEARRGKEGFFPSGFRGSMALLTQ